MAIHIRSGSAGSGRTVCRHSPPPPGSQRGRWGCSHSPSTSAKVSPPSSERNSAAGSTPAHTVSGRSSPAGCSCHTLASAASVPSGNRRFAPSGSTQVRPRSSDQRTTAPQCPCSVPASSRRRPPRPSNRIAYTCSPRKCGPLARHFPRSGSPANSHAPFMVPTASNTSPESTSMCSFMPATLPRGPDTWEGCPQPSGRSRSRRVSRSSAATRSASARARQPTGAATRAPADASATPIPRPPPATSQLRHTAAEEWI